MNDPLPETNVFDVHLPKPGPRGLILKIAAIVLGVGVIAVAVGVIINRAAAPTIDPLAQVMPADTMMFVSMTTHPDQQPNYGVVSNAWKGSKEAKQIESAIAVAVTYAGFDWDTDIKPWLGDRAGVGLIDLGGYGQPITSTSSSTSFPRYRAPFFIAAVQTRDRTKSDKFLSDVYAKISSSSSSSGYYTTTVHDDTYRGITIVYQTTESSYSGLSDGAAYATVNDVIILTQGTDNLKKVIDAALDGKNLSTSNNFKTTMSALPGQNVGALYMDLANYLTAASKMVAANSLETPSALVQRQQSMQNMQDIMQALGGVGMAMTYEPTGLRFDFVAQIDPSKLPDKWRSLYPTTYPAASTQMFDSLPASAIMAINGNVPNSVWQLYLDPNYWSTAFAANPNLSGVDIGQKIADFEKAAGVDLKADLADLFSGNVGLFMLPKSNPSAPNTHIYVFNFPFELGAMFDSSDATHISSSMDKIVNALIATDKSGVQLQPLNRAPYSALLDKQNNTLLAYGPINNRFVIGSTPDTLDAIANANQAPLSADPTFKEATAVLPSDRISTGYFNLSPLWTWAASMSGGSNCGACNYLSAFKWLSIDSQAPANGLQHGSMHIGLQPAKTDLLSQ